MPAKIVYGNDLMYKLRHMAPAPPAASSIPEGAQGIFVLPNAVGTTVHTVAVHKKEKKTVVPAANTAAASSQEVGAAATTSHFAVASGPSATNAGAIQNGYAAALGAMSEAEREKLQEVRNAFLSRFNGMQSGDARRPNGAPLSATATTFQPTLSNPVGKAMASNPAKVGSSAVPQPAAEKTSQKQWAQAAPVASASLAELLSEPVTRNDRRRQEEARTATDKASTADKAVKGVAKPAEKRVRPLEKFPTFMVDTKAEQEQPYFVGPDGRQYPMPPNPFADLPSHLQLGGSNAMDIADFYGWWAQQASFYPEYYTVPVEVPVDSMGNILPAVSKDKVADPNAKKTRRGKRGGTGRGAAAADDTEGSATATPQKSKAAVTPSAITPATVAASITPAATDGSTQPRVLGLGKGRTAPAILTGESLETRHRQRERQILLGKRTLGFMIYDKMRFINSDNAHLTASATGGSRGYVAGGNITEIPSDCHPPPFTQPCSKRSWDGQVRRWRNALHKLDRYAEQFLSAEEIARFPAQSPVRLHMGEDGEEDEDEETEEPAEDLASAPIVA